MSPRPKPATTVAIPSVVPVVSASSSAAQPSSAAYAPAAPAQLSRRSKYAVWRPSTACARSRRAPPRPSGGARARCCPRSGTPRARRPGTPRAGSGRALLALADVLPDLGQRTSGVRATTDAAIATCTGAHGIPARGGRPPPHSGRAGRASPRPRPPRAPAARRRRRRTRGARARGSPRGCGRRASARWRLPDRPGSARAAGRPPARAGPGAGPASIRSSPATTRSVCVPLRTELLPAEPSLQRAPRGHHQPTAGEPYGASLAIRIRPGGTSENSARKSATVHQDVS